MRHIPRIAATLLLVGLTSVLPACAQDKEAASADASQEKPMTDSADKTFFAMGVAMAQNLSQFNLSDEELAQLQEGLKAGVKGTSDINIQEYLPQIQAMAQERAAAAAEKEKAAGTGYLDQKAAEAGATKTESGLIYKQITAGTGASPKATDTVKVHYTGKLRDGKVFDSSVERGQPATFPLNRVIPCWTEGVALMKVGEKAELTCPADLAYGERGAPPNIPGGAVLTFEVELLDIMPAEGTAAQ
ncbi:MAG: FKBP-type peptidyl-prolyl cis-trans isomerase [Acidobacteria bacterium]|nr:FKBP-type peptidyl-prolyl cis-trans isomerase [Acidobacteriota bacterium]